METRTHTVPGPGGRTLRVHEGGAPDGAPVVVCHGTPDDGQLFDPWVADAAARGIRLLGYDRPGYGGSSPHPGRRVADAAADVAAIADALGLRRLAVWGISGGGPHALACAALPGDRVAAVASLASVAPFTAEGLNYFAGMGRDNWVEFGAALQGREAVEPLAREHAEAMRRATGKDIADSFRTLVSPVDDAALGSGLAEFWAASMRDVFAQGPEGWIEDDLAFVEPFGFELDAIAVPVLVWHGRQDRFVPVAHGEWLARAIPGAEARIADDDGHLTLLVERIPAVHEWLLAQLRA